MGWIYILARNYPFWAIPLSVTFFLDVFLKKKPSRSPLKKNLYLLLSITLMGTSIWFIIVQGHLKVVPFLHEVLTGF